MARPTIIETVTEESPLLDENDRPIDTENGDGNGHLAKGGSVEPPLKELPTAQLALMMSGIWLGVFLAAIDSTVIATLSAPISASFQSLSLLSWLASAYLIANAAFQPISGSITDILCRRTGLIFSNVFFAMGNLICGLARTEGVMIFGRVVAGIGGGGLTAISTFVASDLVPLRKRGVWQGVGNIFYGSGAAIGAVFGGWINDRYDWRIAFLGQIPATVVSVLLVYFTVPSPIRERRESAWKRIDFLGAFLLVTTLVLLLFGLNSGGNTVPWTHPLVLTTLPLSAISLGLFVYVENHLALNPVIPVKLLLDRTVLAGCLTNWFTTMCVFSFLFYGPIYFQVKGLSTTQAGLRIVPQFLGGSIGSIGAGLIMQSTGRYYVLNIVTQTAFIMALVLISTFTLTTPGWEHFVSFFVTGLGYSGMLTVTLVALVSAVDHKHHAVITSASYAFRSTGSSIGITIASAVFQNTLDKELWSRLGGHEGAATIISQLRDNLNVIGQVPPEWKADVMGSYMEALKGVFLTNLGIGILGMLVSLAMREHKLHNTLARKEFSDHTG
jgi:MFS family permease